MIRCHVEEYNQGTFNVDMGVVVPNVGDELQLRPSDDGLFRVIGRRFVFDESVTPAVVRRLHLLVQPIYSIEHLLPIESRPPEASE